VVGADLPRRERDREILATVMREFCPRGATAAAKGDARRAALPPAPRQRSAPDRCASQQVSAARTPPRTKTAQKIDLPFLRDGARCVRQTNKTRVKGGSKCQPRSNHGEEYADEQEASRCGATMLASTRRSAKGEGSPMRAADAPPGTILSVREEHQGCITGNAVAKVEVIANMGGGWLHVRVTESHFGRPMCLKGPGWRYNEAHPKAAEQGECRVQSRHCSQWSEHTERHIAEHAGQVADAKRRREMLEEIMRQIGVGTLAPNGRAFFEYEEMVDLAGRLGLVLTNGGAES
jgi:hypothetical protein